MVKTKINKSKLLEPEIELKKDRGKIGKIISNNFKDIPGEDRLKQLKFYLRSGYVAGVDFCLIIREYTDNIISQEKLSGSLNIRNKNIITGEEEVIKKSAEFSSEYDDKYLLRLADTEDIKRELGTDAHEIKLSRLLIKDCISQLNKTDQGFLMSWVYSSRIIQGYQTEYVKLWNMDRRKRSRVIKTIIESLVKILIDETGNK